MKRLSPYAFFLKHGSWSYDPLTETPFEGRRRCAKKSAQAEVQAKQLGVRFEWKFDQFPDLSWMDKKVRASVHEALECTAILDTGYGKPLVSSLCGITDPDDNYRRVIEAQLAAELIAEVAK